MTYNVLSGTLSLYTTTTTTLFQVFFGMSRIVANLVYTACCCVFILLRMS